MSSGLDIRWLKHSKVASSVPEVNTQIAAPTSRGWTVAQPGTLEASQSSSNTAAACNRGAPAEAQQGGMPRQRGPAASQRVEPTTGDEWCCEGGYVGLFYSSWACSIH
jgi:hypothetical protein